MLKVRDWIPGSRLPARPGIAYGRFTHTLLS